MQDWIMKYWLQELFALLVGVVGLIFGRLRKQKVEQAAIKEGMLALLHSEIYRGYAECEHKGFADVHDRENLEYLYRPYHALGGNGTGTDIYNKMRDLPTERSQTVAG